MDIDLLAAKASAIPADINKIEQEACKARQSSDEAQEHLKGLKKFYFLRTKWSWTIFSAIVTLLLFNIILTVMVGCHVLNYEKYPWLLQLTITENFAEIIGLAIIVVKFLFNKSDNFAKH